MLPWGRRFGRDAQAWCMGCHGLVVEEDAETVGGSPERREATWSRHGGVPTAVAMVHEAWMLCRWRSTQMRCVPDAIGATAGLARRSERVKR